MKKTFSKVCGALLASALLFVGCSDITQGAMSSDTIIPLDKPEVTAIAYPGLIYYSWTAIPGADSYDVQILNDNIAAATFSTGASNTSDIFETPTDGLEYTIRVSAHGTARAISTLSSEYAETTVTSIVPPVGTHALDFINYEPGKKSSKKSKKDDGEAEPAKALTLDDINVLQNEKNVYVGFNAKAYLKYQVSLDKDYDETQVSPLETATGSSAVTVNKNDTEIKFTPNITSAGTYTVNVKAFARENTDKYIADMLTVADKITYESFATLATTDTNNDQKGDATIEYLEDKDGDTNVRVSWKPVKVMGVTAPTSYYKVYVKPANTIALTAVEATVTSTQNYNSDNADVTYYITTTIADTDVENTFVIVLTNEGKYADAATEVTTTTHVIKPKTEDDSTTPATVTVSVSGLKSELDADLKYDDIVWTITRDSKSQSITAAYLLQKDKYYAATPTVTDFAGLTDVAATAELDATDISDKTYILKSKNLAEGNYFLMVVISEEGKQNIYICSDKVYIPANTL